MKLRLIVMPQIWNIEQEKDREKEKVGGRAAKLNDKKGSLRSKRFQSSYCAKVRAGAKKKYERGRRRGEEETLT